MEHELELLLKNEIQMMNPTAGMTRREAEEYANELLGAEYYDTVVTEDGVDCITYSMDPADQAEEDEEECIRLFGINFNQLGN